MRPRNFSSSAKSSSAVKRPSTNGISPLSGWVCCADGWTSCVSDLAQLGVRRIVLQREHPDPLPITPRRGCTVLGSVYGHARVREELFPALVPEELDLIKVACRKAGRRRDQSWGHIGPQPAWRSRGGPPSATRWMYR
ncbi:unnamed protein product [Prorocentrum cordatum]|uniref:Uncharacterized protein n=1 Tax=Prorocentrum cordatum TaxID=2364126 RepID=A0ABN9RQY0_9DINO|nr:unnamed protein product [Polarella glacialis]